MVCLLSNGFPTPWGSIGIPTVTVADLVGFSSTNALSVMQTMQVCIFMIIIPFLLVMLTGKSVKAVKGVFGLTLASGLAFVIPMFVVSQFVGAELVMVVASVCSLAVTILMAKRLKPNPEYEVEGIEKENVSVNGALVACAPFILIFVFLLLTSKLIPPVNAFLSQFSTTVYFVNPESGTTFSWINTPGVWIFLSALIGGMIQKASGSQMWKVFKATLKQMSGSIIVMLAVLAAAKIMIYSGMIGEIAAFAIAVMGGAYPIIAPWLGALGTFVTGSGTSSGVLFGQVQYDAAMALGMNPAWMVSLNALGVGVGKMLAPQSVAIALSAVGGLKEDSKLLKMVLPYGAVFLLMASVIAGIGILFFA